MSSTAASVKPAQDLELRFSRGDVTAFNQLHQLYGGRILAYLRPRCLGRISAEDVSQETWMRAWKAHASFDGGNFQAWIFAIAVNCKVNKYRERWPAQQPEGFDPIVVLKEDRSGELAALQDCLKTLGGIFVPVLNAQLNGIPTAEIAAMFGIEELDTVYTRINRAKKEVADCARKKLK